MRGVYVHVTMYKIKTLHFREPSDNVRRDFKNSSIISGYARIIGTRRRRRRRRTLINERRRGGRAEECEKNERTSLKFICISLYIPSVYTTTARGLVAHGGARERPGDNVESDSQKSSWYTGNYCGQSLRRVYRLCRRG